MTDRQGVVLVLGDSSGWNSVVERLLVRSIEVVAVATPWRELAADAAGVQEAITAVGRPVVLVGHSYGGTVITAAAAGYAAEGVHPSVRGLVYVSAFAPDVGECAADLMSPDGTPTEVPSEALHAPLTGVVPAWKSLPSWFVFGDEDLTIPVARHRAMARRAGARGIREVAGATHTLHRSAPDVVSAAIADALKG
ncbi:alpha/beta fold hydrolase [Kribbella sp. NPDC051770]|uniref:alpha/beta fold hydrolase n=1 Tax=Kribbella sp. NPDC051770 TaxID=3155413 RepID=UPI00343B4F53